MDKESKVINRLDSWLSPVINLVMTYKGQRESMADLPKTDNRLGDVYYVISEGKQYAYNGMNWELIDDTHGEGGSASIVKWNDIVGKPDVFYVHPSSPIGAQTIGFYKIETNAEGHIINVVPVTKQDVTLLGIPEQDTTYADATASKSGLMSATDKVKLDGVDSAISSAVSSEASLREAADEELQASIDSKADSTHTHANATTDASGFMSASDKTKLDGVANNANNYTHPISDAGALESNIYKITTDANGHVVAATAIGKEDITALGIPGADTDTTYEVATTSTDGLMSSADKTKLDGMVELTEEEINEIFNPTK